MSISMNIHQTLNLNTVLNHIHGWSQPEHNPLTRFFVTRVAGIGCAAYEALAIGFTAVDWIGTGLSLSSEFSFKGCELCRRVLGLASSLFFGIIFSPEVNFKIHLKLKLVIDNISQNTQKIIERKLLQEKENRETAEIRKKHMVQLEEQVVRTETEIVHSLLKELLA
jgi:hypothetical protein